EVDHGQGHDYWKAAGRRGATARVRRSGARARREDVASAEDDVGAATAPGRGPGRGFAVARRDSCDNRRLGGRLFPRRGGAWGGGGRGGADDKIRHERRSGKRPAESEARGGVA